MKLEDGDCAILFDREDKMHFNITGEDPETKIKEKRLNCFLGIVFSSLLQKQDWIENHLLKKFGESNVE